MQRISHYAKQARQLSFKVRNQLCKAVVPTVCPDGFPALDLVVLDSLTGYEHENNTRKVVIIG